MGWLDEEVGWRRQEMIGRGQPASLLLAWAEPHTQPLHSTPFLSTHPPPAGPPYGIREGLFRTITTSRLSHTHTHSLIRLLVTTKVYYTHS